MAPEIDQELPEWMQKMRDNVDGHSASAKKVSKKGGNVRPTETTEMGGDGIVYEQTEVRGRGSTMTLKPGVEVTIKNDARVVRSADGVMTAIPGGSNTAIDVTDANRIVSADLKKSLKNARRRSAKRSKNRLSKKGR